jgi:mRNA interferase RelE/StbE
MLYWLEITDAVRRQIERIPGHRHQHIKRIIASLGVNPRPPTASELRNRPGRYRIRLADGWRIFYWIDDRLIVLILKIGKKTDSDFCAED